MLNLFQHLNFYLIETPKQACLPARQVRGDKLKFKAADQNVLCVTLYLSGFVADGLNCIEK
jgi:hypothetical protein